MAGLTVSVDVVSKARGWAVTVLAPTTKRLLKPALEEVRRTLIRKKVACQVTDEKVLIHVD